VTSESDGTAIADEEEYDRIVAANARYAKGFALAGLTAPPRRRLAVLACMDARLNVEEALGLAPGDAHIIRNAGALATDDAIRSLVVSQQTLGTRQVLVVAHTGCGLLGLDEPAVRRNLADRTRHDAALALGAFADLETHVHAQVERIREHAWTRDTLVRGLVYEVETGRLREPA